MKRFFVDARSLYPFLSPILLVVADCVTSILYDLFLQFTVFLFFFIIHLFENANFHFQIIYVFLAFPLCKDATTSHSILSVTTVSEV